MSDELEDALASRVDPPLTQMFPIQSERGAAPHQKLIPWSVAEKAYSVYSARYGSGQSLKRMAERGGFAPSEMDEFCPGWRDEVSEIAQLQADLATLTTQLEEARAKGHESCTLHCRDCPEIMKDLAAERDQLRDDANGLFLRLNQRMDEISALTALLSEIAREMDYELFRAGNHPALGVEYQMVERWRTRLTAYVSPRGQEAITHDTSKS